MKKNVRLRILAALTSVPASVFAQTGTGSAPPSASGANIQQSGKTENGITYLCGGIGSREAEAMKQKASDYDLMVTFATRKGAYLADVKVQIADADGKQVLQTTCGAPILLLDFDRNGRYQIEAEADGSSTSRTAEVREGQGVQTLSMTWPVKAVDMGTTPDREGGSAGTGGGATGGGHRQGGGGGGH